MSRCVTPPYRIEYQTASGSTMSAVWYARKQGQIPSYGRPSPANIRKWIAKHNESLQPGGCNDHLVGKGLEAVSACIVRQSTNEVVAEATAS